MRVLRNERGAMGSSAAIAVVSVLLGAAAAFGAVTAVINANAPDDTSAVQSGLQAPVDPETLIPYGG